MTPQDNPIVANAPNKEDVRKVRLYSLALLLGSVFVSGVSLLIYWVGYRFGAHSKQTSFGQSMQFALLGPACGLAAYLLTTRVGVKTRHIAIIVMGLTMPASCLLAVLMAFAQGAIVPLSVIAFPHFGAAFGGLFAAYRQKVA